MTHKVNPHNLRVGVIRGWDSRWNPSDIAISGDRFKNLNVTENIKVFETNQCDIERIVKTMKKR